MSHSSVLYFGCFFGMIYSGEKSDIAFVSNADGITFVTESRRVTYVID